MHTRINRTNKNIRHILHKMQHTNWIQQCHEGKFPHVLIGKYTKKYTIIKSFSQLFLNATIIDPTKKSCRRDSCTQFCGMQLFWKKLYLCRPKPDKRTTLTPSMTGTEKNAPNSSATIKIISTDRASARTDSPITLADPETHSKEVSDEVPRWHVLRCFYGKELAVQQSIQDRHNIECFVPIEKVRQRNKNGRFEWTQRCALTGYIFIHTTTSVLDPFPAENPNTFVMRRKENGLWVPVTVPDRDMVNFIRVAGNKEQRIAYLDPAKLNLQKGDRVRVIGGSFVGVEGTFMQIGGKHEKRVIIQLDSLIAVATAAIPASLVEKI